MNYLSTNFSTILLLNLFNSHDLGFNFCLVSIVSCVIYAIIVFNKNDNVEPCIFLLYTYTAQITYLNLFFILKIARKSLFHCSLELHLQKMCAF